MQLLSDSLDATKIGSELSRSLTGLELLRRFRRNLESTAAVLRAVNLALSGNFARGEAEQFDKYIRAIVRQEVSSNAF